MKKYDAIYLIDLGDGIVWCEDPEPSDGIDPEDVTEYYSQTKVEELLERQLDECFNAHANGVAEGKSILQIQHDIINAKISID